MARKPNQSNSKKTSRGTDRAGGLGAKLGEDPTTIANPYARPAAGCTRNRAVWPQIEWRPDECDKVRFALQRGDDPPGMDVIGGSVWEILYRCIYPHGAFDEIARFRRVVALSLDAAIKALQWLEYGFAEKLILYEVRNLKPSSP